MSRSTIASTVALASLLAEPVVGLAGWWTWSPDTLTPHFAYQDPGSGNILHSSCNSNGSAAFSSDNPNKFPLKSEPKAATPLAVTGWWDDDLNTPIATDDSIINAFFTCDNKTGNYKLNTDGNDVVSDLATAPSVHEKTGLAVTELGDLGGYRLYYHDEDGLVNQLAYDDDTDWRYDGPVSLKKAGGMGIAALQTKDTNVSVAYPYDNKNIAVARFNSESKNKWNLESFPTPLDSPAPTNKTDPSDIRLDSSENGSAELSSFDNAANLGLSTTTSQQTSVFYIGQDAELHMASNVDGSWEVQESPGKKQWPHADNKHGRLAVVSPLESDAVWVYYTSGDKVMELHRDEGGTWATARAPSSRNAINANDSEGSDKSDDPKDTDSGSDSSSSREGSSSSTGITTGAKAGIGIGVGVGVLAVAAAAFFFLRRRRQKASINERKASIGELASRNSYHELQTEVHQPQEMPSTTATQRHELLADTRHGA
ncbi:hypothetical protein FLONG3_4857 [Fusarium longipes]|uniref:Fucose-specific lectin n=1 Tax=Fusarium longipes TaxID=694270 RepID=A0A395SX11_9HYPO|nr:hypothetical protein FLONG3_4857 [Fusarium longipes]